jgi:hypothetical protein
MDLLFQGISTASSATSARMLRGNVLLKMPVGESIPPPRPLCPDEVLSPPRAREVDDPQDGSERKKWCHQVPRPT